MITAEQQLEAMGKLRVSFIGGRTWPLPGAPESIALLVDAEALTHSGLDVRFWRLESTEDGWWVHLPSGTPARPLAQTLRSIASTYLIQPDPRSVDA